MPRDKRHSSSVPNAVPTHPSFTGEWKPLTSWWSKRKLCIPIFNSGVALRGPYWEKDYTITLLCSAEGRCMKVWGGAEKHKREEHVVPKATTTCSTQQAVEVTLNSVQLEPRSDECSTSRDLNDHVRKGQGSQEHRCQRSVWSTRYTPSSGMTAQYQSRTDTGPCVCVREAVTKPFILGGPGREYPRLTNGVICWSESRLMRSVILRSLRLCLHWKGDFGLTRTLIQRSISEHTGRGNSRFWPSCDCLCSCVTTGDTESLG